MRLELAADGCRASRSYLDPNAAAHLRAVRAELAPAIVTVEETELPALRRLVELVVDRGRKHPAKPLAPKLLGRQRIPLVASSYKSSGQLLRSARTLLARAVKHGDHNLYLIGLEAGLFAELWQRAEEAPPLPRPEVPAKETKAASEEPAERRDLDGLLAPLPVPPSVVRQFVGRSPAIALVHQLVVRAARHDEPVLLLGDTGTGKEVVARLIHEQGPQRRRPFTPVNCGAIPSELLESELFGQEPGSHSTATRRTSGLWRAAGEGTLFLDEIADLQPTHQVKILRALEQRRVRAVGGTREVRVHARVIAATNRDLFALVREGRFREDLYYRLRAFLIRTPPLRDRPEDIALLAEHFWRHVTRDPDRQLPAAVLTELARHRWPGNARELKMVLASLHSLFDDREIGVEHLRAVMDYEGHGDELPPAAAEVSRLHIDCLRHLRRLDETLRACQLALRPSRPSGDEQGRDAPRQMLIVCVTELARLCDRPLLFHGAALYELVRRLVGKLEEHLRVEEATPQGARARLRELDSELSLTSTALFEEVAELRREA